MDSAIVVSLISGAFTVFNVVFSTLSAQSAKKQTKKLVEENKFNEEHRNIGDGVQCLLRAEIIRCHDKYTARKYCPVYAKESLNRAYTAYHNLGGNDIATALYDDCMELPEQPPNGENEDEE